MKVKQRTLANIKLRSRSFTVHEANKVLHLNTFNVSKEYGSFITKILYIVYNRYFFSDKQNMING